MQLTQNLLARIRRDNNLKDLIRHSGMLYVSGVLAIALTFLQQMTTAALLGSSDYGRLAIVLSSSLLVTVVLDFRTWEAGSKLLAQPLHTQAHTETVRIISWLFLLEIAAGMVGMLIMIGLAELISVQMLASADLVWLLRLYALSIPFRIITTGIWGVVPRFFNRFDWLAVKAVIYAGLRLILMSGAAFLGLGLGGVVIAALISEVLHFIILLIMGFYIWRRNLPGTKFLDLSRPAGFSEGLRMLPAFWLNSTLLGIHLHLFIPAAALLTTPAQIGILRVGMDVMELLDRAIQPLWVVFTPKIIMLYVPEKMAEFRRYLRQSALMTNLITLPLMCALLLAVWFLLPRALEGQNYNGVVEVTIILVIANAVYIGLLWTRPAIITAGLIAWQNLLTLLLVIVSMSMLLWLAPDGGATGAAMAKGVFMVLSGISSFLLLRSRVQF